MALPRYLGGADEVDQRVCALAPQPQPPVAFMALVHEFSQQLTALQIIVLQQLCTAGADIINVMSIITCRKRRARKHSSTGCWVASRMR